MADTYTGTGQVSLDQAAWDLAVSYALRPGLFFDAIADVKSTNQAPDQGVSVAFTIMNELAVQTATLNQSVDVDAQAIGDAQVTLTLEEKGSAVITTKMVRTTSYVPFDPIVSELVGWNAGESLDVLARTPLEAGDNVRYGGANSPGARDEVIPTDVLRAVDVRRALADLKGANVMRIGSYYAAFAHPDTEFDLRGETGADKWRDPHTYSQPDEIWNGEIGEFEGFRWVVTSTAPLFADAGSSTTLTDVYGTLFVGRQALAKAFSRAEGNGPFPVVIPGPVTDKLRRNVPMGWYWFGKYDRFREASLRRVETASSIGANAAA